MKKKEAKIIADVKLINKIYFIRGQKVMLDRDLAELYNVETKVLKQTVKRNIQRFPSDFMFELTPKELQDWRSQIVTSNSDRMGLRHPPFCFTEQGVTMLSAVLKSKRAIEVNIRVVRLFVRLREVMISNKEILLKLELLENVVGNHSKDIEEIFSVLRQLINLEPHPGRRIGYKRKKEA
jgi:hypothetical protein